MALDPTARQINFQDSIKKYFVESLADIEGFQITFDKSLSLPYLQTVTAKEWVTINWGSFDVGHLSEGVVDIFCCTRKDNEAVRLAIIRDKVANYLIDENATHGMKTIPFYRSYRDQAWTLLGGLLVWDIMESGKLEAPDETKYKIITVRLKFASKA